MTLRASISVQGSCLGVREQPEARRAGTPGRELPIGGQESPPYVQFVCFRCSQSE